MKNMEKRGLAILLIFAMLLSLPSLMISVSAASGETMDLYVDTVTAMPENTVQITIELKNNPGLASLKFNVVYDSYLTLEDVTFDQAFGAYVLAPTPYKNPQTLSFISPLEEVNANGTFATLTFRISDNAPDNYTAEIRVDCDEENVFDGDLSPVGVNVHNGAVNIIHGIPGDIDGDRKVNNKDAIMLFRYVAGWDVTADEAALDVNCDGSVNNKDAITLFRYVAGWDVEIGRGPSSTVCEHRKAEKIPAVLPTCIENGYSEGMKCIDCGKVIEEPVIIPSLGHNYENGVCTRCGDEDESYNPNAPLYVATPDQMYDFTLRPIQQSYWSDIADAEVMTEANRTYIRLIADRYSIGDPYVAFTEYRQNLQIGRYMAISYRTNRATSGQFYLGSADDHLWRGEGDYFDVTWNGDGAWNLAIIDLYSVGLTSLENDILNYARIDFFTDAGAEGDYFDIEYIAFFNSSEAAEQYDFDLHKVPMWDDHYNVVTHLSFDQLYLGTGVADQNPDLNIFFYPGHPDNWDRVARVNRAQIDYLTYWGWVGIMGEVGRFGYQIDGGSAIYNDEWTHETEQGVYDAAWTTGADTASRMKIAISLTELSEGDHTIRVMYSTPDGREVCLTEFVLVLSDEPLAPDDSGIVWGDSSRFAICADNVRYWIDGAYFDGCSSEGQIYLTSLNHVINVDGFSHISFRGWANPTGVEIESFGYQIGNFAPVFDVSFGIEEPTLNETLGGDPDVMRYENIMIPVADLAVGSYKVKLLIKDTNGVVYNMNGAWGGDFTIEKTAESSDDLPYVYQTITLGRRGNGGPFSWLDKAFGQRYDIGESVLKCVSIIDMATYEDGNVNTWSFKVWQWNGDYESTTSLTPLYVVNGENHRNNTTFAVEIPVELGITGDIYYEIEYLSGSKFFTGWEAEAWVAPGVETYLSGVLTRGTYVASFIVGVPFDSTPELPDEPERPEPPAEGDYHVPMEYWSVSGHKPGITSWNDPEHGGMIDAGNLDKGALLHQGAIGVGELDLSKYSRVIVYCGCDNSYVTQEHYANSLNNRIILSKVDTHMTDSPAEEDIIASVTYTLHGWIPEAVIIDLTDVDYNGPVYITYDTLPGTFMLFSEIEFVAEDPNKPDADADIKWTTYRSAADYEEPEEGEEPWYTPAPGYEYTEEGFHMISADYSGTTPFGTIQTTAPVSSQDDFYMELRVDDFAYGGENGYSDHWVIFHIWDNQKITPGSPDYGQGWLGLCRLNNHTINVQSFISNDTAGIISQGVTYITPDIDANGKEIYTFEIVYNGSEYIIYICGIPVAGTAKITNHLNTLDPNGEFYIGVTFYSAVVGSEIEATILKCGKSAMDATTPTGTDSKAPEDNILMFE